MLADRLGHEKVSTTLNTYSHLFPHKQQELVHSLESLQATDSPTPEPPSNTPLLEAACITCEVTQNNVSDVTARPQFGPVLVPPNTASGKIIQIPQRKIIQKKSRSHQGFLLLKLKPTYENDKKRVVTISSSAKEKVSEAACLICSPYDRQRKYPKIYHMRSIFLCLGNSIVKS